MDELPLKIEGRRVYAGFWRRLAALLIDELVGLAVWLLAVWSWRFGLEVAIAAEAVYMVMGGLYFVVFAALLGATPGKLLLGLRITRPDGTPIGWSAAWTRYAVSLALVAAHVGVLIWFLQATADAASWVGPGFWAALVSEPPGSGGAYDVVLALFVVWALANAVVLIVQRRKRAIHDFIGGTVVVRRRLAERARQSEARRQIMTAAEVLDPIGAAGSKAVPPPVPPLPVASDGAGTGAKKSKTRRVVLIVGSVLGIVALIALAVPVVSAILLPEPGVRLPNEMEAYAHEYIAEHELLSEDEELRGYNDASLSMNGTEAAILTDRRIIYHKAPVNTVIMLSEIEEIRHAPGDFWNMSIIEIVPVEGATMKIEIGWGGETFYNALMDAWEDVDDGRAEPLVL